MFKKKRKVSDENKSFFLKRLEKKRSIPNQPEEGNGPASGSRMGMEDLMVTLGRMVLRLAASVRQDITCCRAGQGCVLRWSFKGKGKAC